MQANKINYRQRIRTDFVLWNKIISYETNDFYICDMFIELLYFAHSTKNSNFVSYFNLYDFVFNSKGIEIYSFKKGFRDKLIFTITDNDKSHNENAEMADVQ